MVYKGTALERRAYRSRVKVRMLANGKPRLSVFRSGRYIYAQVIDDVQQRTLAAASSIEKDVRGKFKSGKNKEAAEFVGKTLAERAKKVGVQTVVFDRGRYAFHGRVAALASGAREGGLAF